MFVNKDCHDFCFVLTLVEFLTSSVKKIYLVCSFVFFTKEFRNIPKLP